MSAYLLDVNALVALLWPAHDFHAAVQRWFAAKSRHGWATCPLTQTGLLRILSNPAFSRDAVTPNEALALLSENIEHKWHRFWPLDIGFEEAVHPFADRLIGYRQLTDAYLLGLAIHHRGILATFNQRILSLLAEAGPEQKRIELIRA